MLFRKGTYILINLQPFKNFNLADNPFNQLSIKFGSTQKTCPSLSVPVSLFAQCGYCSFISLVQQFSNSNCF
jgi:hypothetical protein